MTRSTTPLKLSSLPHWLSNSTTVVPSCDTLIVRSLTQVWVAVRSTFTSSTAPVAATLKVWLVPAGLLSGIGWAGETGIA